MSLLLYCVSLDAVGDTRVRGVDGAVVRSISLHGIRYFLSEPSDAPDNIATAAREVLKVVKDVFSRGPVLPFRYPTLLKDEAALDELAAERGESFAEFLQWVDSRVQMDVRLMRRGVANPPLTPTMGKKNSDEASLAEANSGNVAPGLGMTSNMGREYLAGKARLKALLEAAFDRCRKLAQAKEWRVEDRGDSLLCHALIDPHEIISFQERMRRLDLPEGITAVVSGPWPPAGFWEEKSR